MSMDNQIQGQTLRQDVLVREPSAGIHPENEQLRDALIVGAGAAKPLDPIFQTKNRFVVVGSGNEELGEVYVLSPRYILTGRRAQIGPVRCTRVVG